MPRLAIQLLAPALLLTALSTEVSAKPCPDNLLARAGIAMDIPGTRRVALDRTGSCLEIDVSSRGTARLVGLLLRALDVPRHAVRFHVVA